METAESRSRAVGTELEQEVARLEVGFWTPAGPFLRDDLFPHVKGNFRRRVIPVASVHVSKTRSLDNHNRFSQSRRRPLLGPSSGW